LDEVVAFRPLGRKHLSHLLDRLIGELNGRLSDRQLKISLGPKLTDLLIRSAGDGQFGGRALRRFFEQQVIDVVSDRILESPEFAKGAWVVDLDEDGGPRWRLEFEPHKYLPPA